MDMNGKKSLAVSFALLAVSVVTLVGSDQARAEKTTPVSVVSPLPLPVTGGVSVTNAPSVTVNNTNAQPVPVAVVPNPTSPTVTCTAQLDWVAGTSEYSKVTKLTPIFCPGRVNVIDVQRVFYDPYAGLSSYRGVNVGSFWFSVGTASESSPVIGELIAATSSGSPMALLSTPFRLDLSTYLSASAACFSGIVGVSSSCGGAFYIVGTPVQ